MCTALDGIFFGGTENWDLAYRQLWLYIMQNYTDLPAPSKENKTKKKLLAKARPGKVDEVVLSNFAALAIRLGFKSDRISALSQRSADREIARAALLNARKSDRYEYMDTILESNVKQIVCSAFVSDDPAASGVRCGLPDEEAHARDAGSLSIANLHVEVTEQGQSITSFFVRRSVYFAFFGRPSETSTRDRSHPSPPRDPSVGGAGSTLFQESHSHLASDPSGGEHVRMDGERSALEQEGLPRFEPATLVGAEPTGRDQRPGTFTDLQRIITDGLASTEGQATEDLEALVHSYQELISTDNDNANDDRQQQLQQTPNSQLQILPAASIVRIEFKIRERDVWRTDRSLLVDLSDPSEVERVAKKYMRKAIRPFDSSLNLLVPRTCFQAATADGSNTILLVREDDIEVNNQLVLSVSNEIPERELPPSGRQHRIRHS
ncbi:hypothetical protein IFR04_012217 [Cadophora malorum]|uniref:Uncharacterized protein n=1 Tax=Cadophora malorum TaxID=108018 RepID=A0A8H7T811_9HELO|nr:hypothetical protein IFR04_012217 [Cadophora malorum]